ncbi:MAG: peptidylprolyl isomerase [Desulfobacteraceae bacterium]
MQKVENGMFVSVHYTGTLESGEQFDSSIGRTPLEFKVGDGQMIKGFDAQVVGMSLNEKKKFTLAPEDAYGDRNEDYQREFPRSEMPPDFDPQVGQTLALSTPDGQRFPARIAAVDDDQIIFDLNHPLAGQSLTFDIEVVGISETPIQPQGGCDCNNSEGCNC